MQQQQQSEATTEGQDPLLLLPKRVYSLLVSCLKGLLLSNGDTAAGDIRLMLAGVDVAELIVHLCSAAGAADSSSSRDAALSAQQATPWMALAARCVTTTIEMHISLHAENAPGVAEIIRSSTDQREKETAKKLDAPLQQLLPAVQWLVDSLQEYQRDLGVPLESFMKLQQMNSYVQMAMPAAMMGLCMRVGQEDIRNMRVPASVRAGEMANVMHRIAMPILAQTPHTYACNNPGRRCLLSCNHQLGKQVQLFGSVLFTDFAGMFGYSQNA
jgi:hypothetical protein